MKLVLGFLLLFLILVFFIGGFYVHPTCTHQCDQRPEYWYSMPFPGTRYTEAYQVTVDGKPLPPVK